MKLLLVTCPTHGEHEYVIDSRIPGKEGSWCMICWFESLGPSLMSRAIEIKEEPLYDQ